MTSTHGAPVGDAANSEQAELALHPDPHLAARNRIQPTQANPRGYPPFDLRQMPSYTNNQLRYYLTRGQVTDMGAFIKAQRQREDLNRALGLRGDTDDEDELGRFDIGDALLLIVALPLLPLVLSPSTTIANPTINSQFLCRVRKVSG